MSAPDFDDIVFERYNKDYGAYILRKKYNRVVIISIIAACLLGAALVIIPFIRRSDRKSDLIYTTTSLTSENLSPPGDYDVAPPPPPASHPQNLSTVARQIAEAERYVAPEVVDTIVPVEKPLITAADSATGSITDEGITGSTGDGTGNWAEGGGGGKGGGAWGNGAYSVVETMPTFKGGDINKFREWVQRKTKYPDLATINGIQGKVYITFVVETDGSVNEVKVAKGVDPLLDDEALKAVKSSPKWTPGKQSGKSVRVWYMISLNFQL